MSDNSLSNAAINSIYGPSIDKAVAFIKESVQWWNRDDVTITRVPEKNFDPATGSLTQGLASVVWTGKARVTPANPNNQSVGDEVFTYWTTTIYIPWNEQVQQIPRADDVLHIDSTHNDPHLRGRAWRIIDVSVATFGVSRALTCTTLQESGEWE